MTCALKLILDIEKMSVAFVEEWYDKDKLVATAYEQACADIVKMIRTQERDKWDQIKKDILNSPG